MTDPTPDPTAFPPLPQITTPVHKVGDEFRDYWGMKRRDMDNDGNLRPGYDESHELPEDERAVREERDERRNQERNRRWA